MSADAWAIVANCEGSNQDLDFRRLRKKTRVEQGLPDALPKELVDQIVLLTRLADRSVGYQEHANFGSRGAATGYSREGRLRHESRSSA